MWVSLVYQGVYLGSPRFLSRTVISVSVVLGLYVDPSNVFFSLFQLYLEQRMRVFGGGLNRDKERRDQSGEAPEDTETEGSLFVDGNGNTGGDDRGLLLVPVPQRPDQSSSPSLEESCAISMIPTHKMRADKTSSPVSNLPRRRASYPAAVCPRSFVDLRGSDTRYE